MIDSKDISVVVQGAIDKKLTHVTLASIRKHLPKAEIVLSTWEDSNTDGLDYDILVESKDPGNVIHDLVHNVANNCNRQLLSTQNGLEKATRAYCLKLRSDLELKSANFLDYWGQFSEIDDKYKLFQHRILVPTIYSREYSCETGRPTLFHPSDFWLFGLTEDMKGYFLETPLLNDVEACDYDVKYPNRMPYENLLWRYAPEQYFCFACTKRTFPDIQFEDWSDWHRDNLEQSKAIVYNNFIFLGFQESGIYSKKHSGTMRNEHGIYGLITFDKFRERYKEYCDPEYCFQSRGFRKESISNNREKLKEHLVRFRMKIKGALAISSELFSILHYFTKTIFEKKIDKR